MSRTDDVDDFCKASMVVTVGKKRGEEGADSTVYHRGNGHRKVKGSLGTVPGIINHT